MRRLYPIILVYEADKVALDVSGTAYEKTAGARMNKMMAIN